MRLLQLQQATEPLSEDNLSLFIKVWEKDNQIQLAQKQKEAIKACLHHGVLVLTGGPGTGKTTVIKGILSILKPRIKNSPSSTNWASCKTLKRDNRAKSFNYPSLVRSK